MILQALSDYYKRLENDNRIDIPLFGFSRENIHFCLVIDKKGPLVQPVPLMEQKQKKEVAKKIIVPKPVEERTSGIKPYFMWDNSGYVLGVDDNEKPERSLDKFKAFKELHHRLGDNLEDEGMIALLKFLDSWNPENAPQLSDWKAIAGKNFVFQLDGERRFLHERKKIRETWLHHIEGQEKNNVATCLISGERTSIARLHPKIKGVWGTQTSGASLVSFNLPAFSSYGKKQNSNAPLSERAAFMYTTTLNYLLRPESRQKVQIGDAATVFWAERDSLAEGFLGYMFDPKEDTSHIKRIRDLLEAVRAGKTTRDLDLSVKFYILGLSPNASRISVRFWHVSNVGDIISNLDQHFQDICIKGSENDPEFPSIRRILKETAVQGELKNISPLLSGAMMQAILTGEPYPNTLLSLLLGRIRADHKIGYIRASMIKGWLTRMFRINKINTEVSMSLNKDLTNIPYRLGRLFAVLEKAQKDAIPGAKATIRNRFYGSASATPRVVFPQLIRLAQHHIQKSEYGELRDKEIEEIMENVHEFPSHLSLEDQGMFAVGYYHQRQSFFVKKEVQKEKQL